MTEEQEKTYREGDEDVKEPTPINPEVAAENQESPMPTQEQAADERPIEMAVLLIKRADGTIEAATDLPMIKVGSQATVRDVRDMCHSMFCDLQNTLTGKVSAGETNALMRQMFAGMVQPKSNIITPGGRG